MVSARVLIATAASLLVASSIEAGSHLSSMFPDRLQAIKRSTMMKHYDLLERSADPAVQACIDQCKANPNHLSDSSSSSSKSSSKSKSKSKDKSSSSSHGASGNKTITVAPHKGVLKFVPFSTNAKVGETITFKWGAGPHTLTQSSGFEICNETKAVPEPFNTGPQDAGFEFPVTIENAEAPTWFYCQVKTHCLQGMFGLVNPTTTTKKENTMSTYISNLWSKDESFGSLANETKSACEGNEAAWNWGSSFDVSSFPETQIRLVAENVMETRKFFAANPQELIAHGVVSGDDEDEDTPASSSSQVSSSSSSLPSGVPVSSSSSSAANSNGKSDPAAAAAEDNNSAAGMVTLSGKAAGLVAVTVVALLMV